MADAIAFYDSPIGRLRLVADPAGRLCGLSLGRGHGVELEQQAQATQSQREVLDRTVLQLQAYFRGHLKAFDLPLNLVGTDFQRQVWRGLIDIGYGQTVSYAELARRIGSPSAARAVGLANGANPLLLIVPCHRVIGAKGDLTGFAAGLHVKKWLLDFERQHEGLFATVKLPPIPASVS